MAATISGIKELEDRLVRMANEQIASPEYRKLYDLKLTNGAAQVYILQRAHFVLNRRDCWGYVQGASPFDVKRLIWEHEQEELAGDPERGVADHYTLGVEEGAAVGLTADDFRNTAPDGGVATCCFAWLHLAKNGHWLEALAASCILEIANSDEIVKGGGNARRIGEKMRDELGISFKKQPSNAEHMVAEIEHAHLLLKVAEKYVHTDDGYEHVLRGARNSLAVDRVYKAVLADAMAAAA
ncbi:MAG: iron-containing redox enzyme family protein [Alphaproteobacteria bacterium]|jgi:pyrroloquinoline quinone (PQQ) biosynthesis protein C